MTPPTSEQICDFCDTPMSSQTCWVCEVRLWEPAEDQPLLENDTSWKAPGRLPRPYASTYGGLIHDERLELSPKLADRSRRAPQSYACTFASPGHRLILRLVPDDTMPSLGDAERAGQPYPSRLPGLVTTGPSTSSSVPEVPVHTQPLGYKDLLLDQKRGVRFPMSFDAGTRVMFLRLMAAIKICHQKLNANPATNGHTTAAVVLGSWRHLVSGCVLAGFAALHVGLIRINTRLNQGLSVDASELDDVRLELSVMWLAGMLEDFHIT